MDVGINGTYVENQAILRLNLEGESNVHLNFWWKEFLDESHVQDGVYFSDDGGVTFKKVYDLSGAPNDKWQEVHLKVDQLASSFGLSLSSTFHIKFQQYDNLGIPSDGIAVDDINVSSGLQYAQLDYFTSFEANDFDQYWETHSSSTLGQVSLSPNSGPIHEDQHVIMDAIGGLLTTNEATLRVSLSSHTEVKLAFAWKETDDETHAEDGIYFSDIEGGDFVKVFDLTNGAYDTWNLDTLDVDSLCSVHGLTLTHNFHIKFSNAEMIRLVPMALLLIKCMCTPLVPLSRGLDLLVAINLV